MTTNVLTSMKRSAYRAALASAALLALIGCATHANRDDAQAVRLAGIDSIFVRGHEVELRDLPDREVAFAPGVPKVKVPQNGEFETGQLYAQRFRLAQPRSDLPVLFWHGGGLTGATWESTPDGRPGWAWLFLKAGYNVVVSDSVERGRSGFSQFPEVYKSAPIFRTKKEAWEAFRIGTYDRDPQKRQVFPGQQFPAAYFDQFFLQSVPRWVDNDQIIQHGYDALVERVCPCIIVAHSQGGIFAIRAAASHPRLVRALVLLEPSGTPPLQEEEMRGLQRIPQLLVWGDFIEQSRLWQFYRRKPQQYYETLRTAGDITWLELPRADIKGNSHMLMMDRNTEAVAARVLQWLQEKSPSAGAAG